MWGDAFMAGSCLYDSSQDRNFSKSVSQSIWPRTAIAAGSFWGPYRQVPDNYLQATLEAVPSRLTVSLHCRCRNQFQNHAEHRQSDWPEFTPPTGILGDAWACLLATKVTGKESSFFDARKYPFRARALRGAAHCPGHAGKSSYSTNCPRGVNNTSWYSNQQHISKDCR